MPATPISRKPASLVPGTVVSVWVFPFFRHKGIVSDRWDGDKPMVIANSARAGGVAEESWDIFAAGQTVVIEGYPSNLPSYVVLQRARSLIAKKYNLFAWNCEHLTAHAHGMKHESPQIAVTLIAVALGTIILMASAD